jgi:hypothetical protein
MVATVFKLHSIDFLVPYSFDPPIHPRPNHSPPFGAISKIAIDITIPEPIISSNKRVVIIQKH